MNVHLLFPDRGLSLPEKPDPGRQDRAEDLEMGRILEAMAQGDGTIRTVCRHCLDHSLTDPALIRYRQAVLGDCLQKPDIIRSLYDLCLQTEENRKSSWYGLNTAFLSSLYSSALDLLRIYTEALKQLRQLADLHGESFDSPGFARFFSMLQTELTDEYFTQVRELLNALSEKGGTLISGSFGSCLQGAGYGLRQQKGALSRLQWMLAPSFTLAEQDTLGAKDLDQRRDRAINQAAHAMAQAAGHLEGFWQELRQELAFYVGALNLYDSISALSMPVTLPRVDEKSSFRRSFLGLYDGSLALLLGGPVVGNDLEPSDQPLTLVTGANQGGKTTFLRSLGQCQLMAQCGLFVFAESCQVPVRGDIFTHFKREEDHSLRSGRLDQELCRMSAITDALKPGDLILFNESFSSTNQREGSEILGQITQALVESGMEVVSVTHLIPYALHFAGQAIARSLVAGRQEDGSRSFRLTPGMPGEKAGGQDIYREVFGE